MYKAFWPQGLTDRDERQIVRDESAVFHHCSKRGMLHDFFFFLFFLLFMIQSLNFLLQEKSRDQ